MRKIVYAFIIVLTCVVSSKLAAQPRITSNKEVNKIGQVEWKHPITAEFTITNTGNKPLVMNKVTVSCACMVSEWTKQPIAPGKSGRVVVTYDAKTLGYFEKFIGIYSNATPNLTYLKIKGEVVRELKDYSRSHPYSIGSLLLDRNELNFSDVVMGNKKTLRLSVVNNTGRPYEPTLMHLPSYVTMESSPKVLQKGKRGTIVLTLNTNQITEYGLTQTPVFLARFSGDKVEKDNKLPLSAVVIPNFANLSEQEIENAPVLSVSATELDFSNSRSKNKVSNTLILSNKGKSNLEIYKIQVSHLGVEMNLRKKIIKPGESEKLHIRLLTKKIDKLDNESLSLLLITNDPTKAKTIIKLSY